MTVQTNELDIHQAETPMDKTHYDNENYKKIKKPANFCYSKAMLGQHGGSKSDFNKYMGFMDNLLNQVDRELSEIFGDRQRNGKFMTTLDLNGATIPKEVYDEPTIKLSHLRNVIVPKLYHEDVYDIYNQLLLEMTAKHYDTSPVKKQLRLLERRVGLSPKDMILQHIYGNLSIYVDIEGLPARSGIELIEDITEENISKEMSNYFDPAQFVREERHVK